MYSLLLMGLSKEALGANNNKW